MKFSFPDVGEGITEGEIVKWYVKPGDIVAVDQVLVSIETDKAVVEIPSPYAGRIVACHGDVGSVVNVGDVLVEFSGEDSLPEKKEESLQEVPEHGSGTGVVGELEEAVADEPVSEEFVASTNSKQVRLSPRARQLALELGVGLKTLTGTGVGGVITEGDVRAAAGKEEVVAKVTVQRKYDLYGYVERVPLTSVRKATAVHMQKSWHVPHVTHMDVCDVTDLVALRAKEKEKLAADGVHLTYLPFIIAAVCKALPGFLALNATLADAEIIYKKYYNVGLAVQTEHGLLVPVVKGADKKSIKALAVEAAALAQKARDRSLDAMDMQGGTFTITNVGGIGGRHFTPILVSGQTGILGIGRLYQAPVFYDSRVVVRWLLPFSLSFDHRVVDGAVAASFAEAFKKYLSDVGLLSG